MFNRLRNQPDVQPEAPPAETTPTETQKDNAGVSDDDLGNLWDAPEPEKSQESDNKSDPNSFDDYVKGLDLGVTIDPNQLANDLQEGNTNSLNAALQESSTKLYKQVVKDLSNAVEQMLNKQQADMRREFGDMYKQRTIEQQIDQKFPGLKDAKAVRPVFLAAAQQMQAQGKSDGDIIKTLDTLAKQFGQQSPTSGESNQFGRPARNQEQSPEWMKILTGKE